MDFMDNIKPGMTREETFSVADEHTAYHIGSGDERVLGTPWMISFMERVSNRLILECLPNGYMSVGIHVDVKHLAPTQVGCEVRIRVEIIEIIRKRIILRVEAWDEIEEIGNGIHTRAVVEKVRFLERAFRK